MNAILYSKKFNRYNIKKYSPRKKYLYRNRSIDGIFQERMNLNSSGYQQSLAMEKQKINKLKALYGYKNPNLIKTQRNNWRHNLTKPKLPFSQRINIPKDIRLKKIESLKPSLLYHDNHVINWIRNKYSQSVIEKSLYSILPEKDKTQRNKNETESEKRKRKMVEFLEDYKELKGREKFVKIHPKYFYDETTFEKIKKLKDIFLAFDNNGNYKMSIDEIVNMFNDNNIKVNEEDIAKLFFKDKKFKKKEYFKLYLSFYQFLKFALHNDQEFRIFMRKIKSKYDEEIEKNNSNIKDKNIYLPMNLNLLFDFFITKAKEKSSIKKIEKAINSINKVVINREKYNSDNDSLQNLKKENSEKMKKKVKFVNENLNYEDDIDLLENIDFLSLFDEFANLFNLNKLEDFEKAMKKNKDKNKINDSKAITKDYKTYNKIKEFNSVLSNMKNNALFNNSTNKENIPILYELSKNKDDEIANAIKRRMNQTTIIQLNMDNYKKYHNLKLALEATKENIKELKTNLVPKSNGNYELKNNFNKNMSLKSLSILEKKYKMNLNDNFKKSFLFQYKNLSKSNSMKLFTKNELLNFKKNSFSFGINNNSSMDEKLNIFSNKLDGTNSSNLISKEKTGYYSSRKFDYVPIDLFKKK